MRAHLIRLVIGMFIGVFLLSKCNSSPSPETVALGFFQALYNDHDLDAAEALVTKASRDQLHSDFKFIEGAVTLLAEDKPVVYDYRTVDEKTRITGDSAFVSVWTSLDSSTIETLLLMEDGDWRVDFSYPSRQQTTKSLVDEVLQAVDGTTPPVQVAKPVKN